MTAEQIQASLASIPSRKGNLQKVIVSLLPQVDVIRVYLNGYDHVPSFLSDSKIVVARSQDHGDNGDAGKFFWCEDCSGYQLICDDDLIYHGSYVQSCIRAIEKYNRKVVVGLHGVLLNDPPRSSYYDCRKVIHWKSTLKSDRFVHILATCSLAYHKDTVHILKSDFKIPNMADIWLGLTCQSQSVPMLCFAREIPLVVSLDCPWTIYGKLHGRDKVQCDIVNRIDKWKINKP